MKLFLTPIILTASLVTLGCSDQTKKTTLQLDLSALCDQTYQGAVISDDPQDADWRSEVLVMGPVDCTQENTLSIPLAVGDNKTRTWIISGLDGRSPELRHRHILDDGSLDPVTNYGGFLNAPVSKVGKAWRLDFPADAETVDVFMANGLDVSITNVWTIFYTPRETFLYQLTREDRDFRAEFNLAP